MSKYGYKAFQSMKVFYEFFKNLKFTKNLTKKYFKKKTKKFGAFNCDIMPRWTIIKSFLQNTQWHFVLYKILLQNF